MGLKQLFKSLLLRLLGKKKTAGDPVKQQLHVLKSASEEQPAEFHPFNRLPCEIRLLIWRFSIESLPGRKVEVFYKPRTGKDVILEGRASVPALQHTCRESRYEFLNSNIYVNFFPKETPHPTYFDVTKDQLVFHRVYDLVFTGSTLKKRASGSPELQCWRQLRDSLRYLAIRDDMLGVSWSNNGGRICKEFDAMLRRFKALEEFENPGKGWWKSTDSPPAHLR